MKNKYLSLLAVAFLAFACTGPDEILDDFQVHISPTFFNYVVEIDVEDLVDPTTEITEPISVELSGPDAGAIYNIDGTKDFQVNFGTLQLMVAKEMDPVAGDPLEFTVEFKANNYQEASLRFNLEEGDYYVGDVARLLNLNNLPGSMGSTQANGGIDPNTNSLVSPLVVDAGSQDSLAKMKMTIPTDVKFLDEDGNEIVGKRGGTGLSVSIISSADSSEAAQAAYPNGTGLIQLVEEDGVVDTVLLEQAEMFNINMELDGVPVRSFSGGKTSGGVTTRVALDPDAYNVEFDRAYQAGDSISMMSLSHDDNSWKLEPGTYVVLQDPQTNELYYEATITHLSHWRSRRRRFRWRRPSPRPRFGMAAYYAASSGAVSGRVRGILSYRWRGRWRSCYTGMRGNFGPNWRTNRKRVWRSSRYTSFRFLPSSSFPSSVYNLRTERAGIFYVLKIEPRVTPPSIGYRLYCGTSNTLVDPPNGVKMYFRRHTGPNSNAPFSHLYTFDQSNQGVRFATFPQLEKNVFYDFRAQFGDVQKDTFNVQIIDNRIYEVRLPPAACSGLGL